MKIKNSYISQEKIETYIVKPSLTSPRKSAIPPSVFLARSTFIGRGSCGLALKLSPNILKHQLSNYLMENNLGCDGRFSAIGKLRENKGLRFNT